METFCINCNNIIPGYIDYDCYIPHKCRATLIRDGEYYTNGHPIYEQCKNVNTDGKCEKFQPKVIKIKKSLYNMWKAFIINLT